jgi:hypothetical protein
MKRLFDARAVYGWALLGLAVLWLIAGPAWAGRASWEAGLQAGKSFNDEEESFSQYDLFASYGLPWSWQWGQAVQVDTNLTTVLGVLDGGGDTGMAASLGFEFVFGSAAGRCPFELRAGSALTYLGKERFGDEDFGGPFQFTHHISLYYWFLQNLSVVARVQHMSNGGMYHENPGLNMAVLALVYLF